MSNIVDSQAVKERKEYLLARMDEYGIPPHSQHSLLYYIIDGVPTGGFLQAVLQNKLFEAVHRGDEINQRALVNYVRFLYNHAPNGCYGREDVMTYWRERGGLRKAIEITK